MGDLTPPNPPIYGNIDYDFVDQLLDEGCWLHTADGSDLNYPSYTMPSLEVNSTNLMSIPNQRLGLSHNPYPRDSNKAEEVVDSQCQDHEKAITPGVIQVNRFCYEGDELNRILWIAPKANPEPSTSVKDRLMNAIYHLRELNINRDVLIQIWVPIKKGVKSFLTTVEQPHFFHPTSTRLINYRDVSEKYEFLADENTKQALGLPGRVFLGKAPEWTPDVRFFRQEEYPRVKYAHMYDVRGSIALPVFERGSGDCLGVVEIIMTTEKINYRPEVESVCHALESVDLRSSEILNTSLQQAEKGSHEAVHQDILNVLKTVCDTHDLPLAQTWAPCSQQSKGGCWHSDKNTPCVSTIDSACYIRDQRVIDYHRACSEHHLLRGRGGIVGKAFETNQPCFATDVTEFSKVDYPLSHHAKIFGLRAAVAIQIHSSYRESRDYVLEFYLPSDFQETGLTLHGRVWESISNVMQHNCPNLHLIADNDKIESSASWFSNMIESQRKGKEVAVSLEFGEEEPSEEFQVTTQWKEFSDNGINKPDFRANVIVEEGIYGSSSGNARKFGERKKTKTQKTISLQVLRQYFAGSLKDAAKSIGVCPTTLKRICRQHGINRWPSRKIKKVGHSLKKLQLVIDSVHGAEGSFQLSSFYTNFPELDSPNTPQPTTTNQIPASSNPSDHSKQQLTTQQPEGAMTTSNSRSNSSSQTSTSSHCFSAKEASLAEDPGGSLKRARSEAELQELCKKQPPNNQLIERSQSNKSLTTEHHSIENLPPLPLTNKSWLSRGVSVFKAKAIFGEEKIRLTILPNMGFQELQQEIAKRFNMEDYSKIGIKYLDDDKEWVLLTCDADLEECIDIHKSSTSHTIKLAISTMSSSGGSFGRSGFP